MSCWICDKANGTCEHVGGSHLDERVAALVRIAEVEADNARLRAELAAAREDVRKILAINEEVTATAHRHCEERTAGKVREALANADRELAATRAELEELRGKHRRLSADLEDAFDEIDALTARVNRANP